MCRTKRIAVSKYTIATMSAPVALANNFGNVEIRIPIYVFNKAGFRYGDSVDVVFSNGYAYHDIPYYNSFIGPARQPCLYGFEYAYTYIGVGYPVTGNPWEESRLKPGDTARVFLNRRGKYLAESKLYSLNLQVLHLPGKDDAWRGNQRGLALPGGESTAFFRSASPIRQDTHCLLPASKCLEAARPGFVLNLSDNADMLQQSCAENPQLPYAQLFREGKVEPLQLGIDFTSTAYAQTLVRGLEALICHQPPYLLHCKYGLDRTGFVCIVLEALAGTSLDSIGHDYMQSYCCIYGLIRGSMRYQANKLRRLGEMLSYLCGLVGASESVTQENIQLGAIAYLLKGGMSDDSIVKLSQLLASGAPGAAPAGGAGTVAGASAASGSVEATVSA